METSHIALDTLDPETNTCTKFEHISGFHMPTHDRVETTF